MEVIPLTDVAALGEILIDFTPAGERDGVPLMAQNPGGAPANVLAMAARLGSSTAFIGKVGQDSFGDYLEAILQKEGIDSHGLVRGELPTTLAFVHVASDGERSFTFYRNPGADSSLSPEELNWDIVTHTRVFHFGGVSLTHNPARAATTFAVRIARQAGSLITFDPNYRPALWKNEAKAVEVLTRASRLADVIKLSLEEMVFLTGTDHLELGTALIQEMSGAALIVVSLGERGAYYRLMEQTGQIPAFKTDAVDTTGAGDAFFGTLIHYLAGRSRRDVEGLSPYQLEKYLDCANAAGALTVTKPGAIPSLPSREEILDLAALRS